MRGLPTSKGIFPFRKTIQSSNSLFHFDRNQEVFNVKNETEHTGKNKRSQLPSHIKRMISLHLTKILAMLLY